MIKAYLLYLSIMAYLERDFQRDFNKWCKHNFPKTAAFELKATKEKSLPFSRLEDHQKNALLLAKHSSVIFKIPDAGFQNPFDSFILHQVPAFVVIMFATKNQKFVMIDIDDWMFERETNTVRKSMTEERAYELGTIYTLNI